MELLMWFLKRTKIASSETSKEIIYFVAIFNSDDLSLS